MERSTGHDAPDDEDRGLAFLRFFDRRIAAVHPDHLRYPPGLLAQGFALVLSGNDIAELVELVARPEAKFAGGIRAGTSTISRLAEADTVSSRGGRAGLQAISAAHIPIAIVTEERPERCRSLLAEHGLDSLITEVISVRKSVEVVSLRQRPPCVIRSSL